MYRMLDPEKIIATLDTLRRRIGERFPGAGLGKVCEELLSIARTTESRIEQASRPNVGLRLGIAALLITGIVLLIYLSTVIEVKRDAENLFGVLQGVDAAMNTLVLMGAGILFLATLESRWNRQQSLRDLHELRSIVHVIDMHQLTKDPHNMAKGGRSTPSSPVRELSPFELSRYLDYCTEMLSLCAKLAALHAQGTKDPIVIEAASDIGQTTSSLANKIWQKITIVQGQSTFLSPAAVQPPGPVNAS